MPALRSEMATDELGELRAIELVQMKRIHMIARVAGFGPVR